MPFGVVYPKEVYKDGASKVVFSVEVHQIATAEGWSDVKPVAKPTPAKPAQAKFTQAEV